jgi:branched-chain amino acid transport system ATP-binding protein
MFPVLYARRNSPATRLSGGEQRMLALARVLRTGARLLLCDEPTEGLSPLLMAQVGEIIRHIKDTGGTVLLVEQNLRFAATVADRHYLLAEGRIVDALDNSEVQARFYELLDHLGI